MVSSDDTADRIMPTGTVTFLYTDIEGSTKLAQQFPDVWNTIQVRHHAILQNAITTHSGFVFRTIGDEFNAAFTATLEALTAALAVQRALHAENWGAAGQIRVRMGLHTGSAAPLEDDYEGYLTLSLTKRLMSTAYGGQILVSEAAEALLRGQLPQDIILRNLGVHRLKTLTVSSISFRWLQRICRLNFRRSSRQLYPQLIVYRFN
jgi:class 3 adenylate cyclase